MRRFEWLCEKKRMGQDFVVKTTKVHFAITQSVRSFVPEFVYGLIDLYESGECSTDQVCHVFGHLVANELTKSVPI